MNFYVNLQKWWTLSIIQITDISFTCVKACNTLHTDYDRIKLSMHLSLQLMNLKISIFKLQWKSFEQCTNRTPTYMYFSNNTTAPAQYTIILFLLEHITKILNRIEYVCHAWIFQVIKVPPGRANKGLWCVELLLWGRWNMSPGHP